MGQRLRLSSDQSKLGPILRLFEQTVSIDDFKVTNPGATISQVGASSGSWCLHLCWKCCLGWKKNKELPELPFNRECPLLVALLIILAISVAPLHSGPKQYPE